MSVLIRGMEMPSDNERVSMAYRFEPFGKSEQSPWISIKEIDRLPDDGVKVICISKNGRVSDCDCLKSYVTKFGNYDMTTHWMPLPEPPKEET